MRAVAISGKAVMLIGVLMLIQALAVTATAQNVYKSVDDEGLVTFTDRPPNNLAAETVSGLDIDRTDRDQIDADKAEADEQAKYDQAAQDIREQQSKEDAELQTALNDQRNAACRAATARLEKYKNARRLYREQSDGERDYLNDDELDAERAEAARAVDELCG